MKTCRKCGETKPLSEFNRKADSADGLRPDCKPCRAADQRAWRAANPERARGLQRAWRERNPGANEAKNRRWAEANPETLAAAKRDSDLRRLYGISAADYDAMFESQRGLCAVCERPPGARRLHVDHDHATGAVRGLLCSNCNTAIGKLREDPVVFARAVSYLEAAAT